MSNYNDNNNNNKNNNKKSRQTPDPVDIEDRQKYIEDRQKYWKEVQRKEDEYNAELKRKIFSRTQQNRLRIENAPATPEVAANLRSFSSRDFMEETQHTYIPEVGKTSREGFL